MIYLLAFLLSLLIIHPFENCSGMASNGNNLCIHPAAEECLHTFTEQNLYTDNPNPPPQKKWNRFFLFQISAKHVFYFNGIFTCPVANKFNKKIGIC